MILRLLLAVLLATAGMGAQSQPPTPTSTPRSQGPQRQTGDQGTVSSTDGQAPTSGVTVIVNNPPSPNLAEAQPQQTANDQQPKTPTSGRDGLDTTNIVLLLIFNGVLAVFTVRLWIVTRQQKNIAEDSLATNKTIERAYVSLSHDAPGIYQFFGHERDARRESGPKKIIPLTPWCVSIKIANRGNTPADIVDSTVFPRIEQDRLPPYVPDKTPIRTTKRVASLTPRDHMFKWKLNDPISPTDYDDIEAGRQKLFVIAVATYVDRFGCGHRVGYARRYIPTALPGSENNLVFGDGTEDGWNYEVDIETKKPNEN